MSIATLKKKTQAQYNNMSVGSKHGFSLNGTHRSQGYVGQTMLSRSLPKTLMKGHGGLFGTYHKAPVVLSAVTSLNNPTVVKPSVLGTNGMLNTHFRWIRRPQPYSTVKPDNNNNLNAQHDYITRLSKQTISEADKCSEIKKTVGTHSQKCSNKDAYFKHDICSYTKDESDYVAMSNGEHITKIHDICTKNDIVTVKTVHKNTPFACGF